MTTTTSFKPIITLPQARMVSPVPFAWTTGHCIVNDFRNNEDRHPILYYMQDSSNNMIGYNIKNNGWISVITHGTGSPLSGSLMFFAPSQGPSGTLAAGATTTSVVLNTALPAAVGVNQLANRGDGRGFRIRIIGLSAGGSGLTEEKLIVGNSGGTQPTIYLDSALTFTPAATDRYEILSGRVFIIMTHTAGGFKYYDIATNSMSGNLSVAGLPSYSSTVGNVAIVLDELHVPSIRAPGEGYFGNLTATASGAASLTGQAAGGDAGVATNEYRNFQIRIVSDVGTPTAAGQRRNITSHTAGASPVYTVPAWSVQPSATATYVIENNSDRVVYWNSNGSTNSYCYNITANTWDTTTWAARPAAISYAGFAVHAFGLSALDAGKNARYSHILCFRGNGATLDVFDIAGAATGSWSSAVVANIGTLLVTQGLAPIYCPATESGRYVYFNVNSSIATSQRVYRFDILNRVLESYAFIPFDNSGTIVNQFGYRMASSVFVDGSTKIGILYMVHSQTISANATPFWQILITN